MFQCFLCKSDSTIITASKNGDLPHLCGEPAFFLFNDLRDYYLSQFSNVFSRNTTVKEINGGTRAYELVNILLRYVEQQILLTLTLYDACQCSLKDVGLGIIRPETVRSELLGQ